MTSLPPPLSMIIAWLLLLLPLWTIARAVAAILHQAQQMHRIPCHHCRFYSGDPYLKCTVHPRHALTESAINCPDFKR
ncbi:hypothetical protein [Thermostichus vulcanus]|uniref:Secreted protein n=1 Tax=Thermostichus vulcanus str. 'Rupite' TaxID=2813851 RepID=A0ABT0CBH7_THEVL|nr:hypothetical protein [Thermostichus vulcanus]MCJ2543143.1 hypothetical protein [Thermostichus vulcanus str. 'Rupite']